MAYNSLAEHHLTCSQHTAPACIACLVAAMKWLLDARPIGEPSDGLKCILDLVDHLVYIVVVAFLLLVKIP